MIASLFGFTISVNAMISDGTAAWTDRRGNVLAVTQLYDPTDPTDECTAVHIPTGMADFVHGLLVSPKDNDTIKRLINRNAA